MKKILKRTLSICLSLSIAAASLGAGSTVAAGKAKLSTKKIRLKVGQQKKIAIKGKKAKAKYIYSSSAKAKVSVSKKGVIKAKKPGKATVLVKEKYKKKTRLVGKINVTVKAKKSTNTTGTDAPDLTPSAAADVSSNPSPTAPALAPTPTAPAPTPTATAPEATLTPSPNPTTPAAFTNTDFTVPERIQMKNQNCSGEVEEFVYDSTAITAGKTVQRKAMIALPFNYDPSQKYPVVYALHGFNCWYKSMIDDGAPYISWNAASRNKARDVILVCPSVCANESGNQEVAAYDNFINDLTQCLMPAIENHYPVLTGRENTAIWGFSMGGRESFQIGFTRPDLFGYIGGMCAAPGTQSELFPDGKFKLPDEYKNNTLVLIVKGAQDNLVGDSPLLFHKTLEETGTPHLYYETMGFGGGGHSNQVFLHGYYNLLVRAFPKQ